MTDRRGTFEHAYSAEPNPDYGYCTDDMARILVVATRETHPDTVESQLQMQLSILNR